MPITDSLKRLFNKFIGRGAPERKIGLALSGGAVWTTAHIGVLEALEELGVKPAMVAGTSGGSIIGAMWCAGMKAEEIKKIALSLGWKNLSKFNFIPRRGIFSNAGLGEFMISHIGDIDFNELKIPMKIVATELSSGEKHVFDTGKVAEGVRASCAIPGIFEPFEKEGRLYADGMLVEKTPVKTLREAGMNTVISVYFRTFRHEADVSGIFDIILRSLDIALAWQEKEVPQLSSAVITPEVKGLSRISFGDTGRLIEAGREAALANAPLLLKMH